ncbi:MAG: site-specific integrase [Oscillospiraceae bacterium]|nr:site-specific integrase [Oscillospiraceae bacterium]
MATGSIREKKSKTGEIIYQITIEGGRDPLTGKRIRSFKNVKGSKREANSVMHRLITEMEQGKIIKKSNKSVGEWMDEWVSSYLPNIEETTVIGYKTKIRCYIKPALGEILITSLRAEHIQRMINDMINRGLSPKNIRDTYNNVNAAMKKAVATKLIPYNPCEGVALPKLKKYRAKVYSTEMIHTLLNAVKDTDMYLPVLLFVTVGLRRGELLALRWQDIDFENNLLMVRYNMVCGENGYIIKPPKSEASIRDIHIGDDVVSTLKFAKEKYMKDLAEYGKGFQNLGFIIRQDDGSPISPNAMTRKWRRFLNRNEDLPKIRLHDLRHSNATALIQAGVSPKVVQQRLGHADVNITLNTYTHVLPEMDIEAAKKLDEIMLTKQTI